MNALEFFGHEICQRIVLSLAHSLWIGALITLLTVLISAGMRGRSAQVVYASNLLALIVLALSVPIAFLVVEPVSLARLTSGDSTRDAVDGNPMLERGPVAEDVHRAIQSPLNPSATSPIDRPANVYIVPDNGKYHEPLSWEQGQEDSASAGAWWSRGLPWLASGYLIGVLLMLCRIGVSLYGAQRWRRLSVEVTDPTLLNVLSRHSQSLGLRLTPCLAYCKQVAVPTVVGIVRPIVLIPVSLTTSMSPEEIESLLVHELAHIRRLDPWVNLVQRLIEAALFFNPAVWLLSRRVSMERENCCDDLVIRLGIKSTDYAHSLVRVAELSAESRSAYSSAALQATGEFSKLGQRVERILGIRKPQRFSATMGSKGILAVILAFGIGAMLMLAPNSASEPVTEGDGESSTSSIRDVSEREWGDVVDGLRIRVVPVDAEMSEDAIDMGKVQRRFTDQKDLAFAVEVENVSDRSIRILDTRFGKSYGDHHGKANSNGFAQFLFSIDYFDADGKLVDYPEVESVAQYLYVGSAQVSELGSGQTYRFLIRPAKWRSVMYQRLRHRNYTAAVHYHGLTQVSADRLSELEPTGEVLETWRGDVVSAPTRFQIARPVLPPTALNWGPPENGLRAAMSVSPFLPWYGHGQTLDTQLHFQNVSDKPITLATELTLSTATLSIKDASGDPVETSAGFGRSLDSGVSPMVRITLKPRQKITLDAGSLGVALTPEQAQAMENSNHGTMVLPPGEYDLRLRFESWQTPRMADGKGTPLAPVEGDYVGNLTTGRKLLFLKEQPFDMSTQQVPNLSTPRQWAEIYVNEIKHRRNSDGVYPSAVFATLRECLRSAQNERRDLEPGMEAWEAAIDAKETWTHPELLAHVLKISQWSFPVVNAAFLAEQKGQSMNTLRSGRTPGAEELAGIPFGKAAENGLRVAWVFDSSGRVQPGEAVRGRMVFHNSGDTAVTFSAEPWGMIDWDVRDRDGRQVQLRRIPLAYWIGTYLRYRLKPGEIAEVIGEPLGFGALADADQSLATTWIPASSGDVLTISGQIELGHAKPDNEMAVSGDYVDPLLIREHKFEISGTVRAEGGGRRSVNDPADANPSQQAEPNPSHRAPPASVRDREDEQDTPWGDPVNGIQCRLIAVSTESDDESPARAQAVDVFPSNDDLAFTVELKNVSDQSIVVLGTRYGDGYGDAAGKLNTDFLGPHLFEFDFRDPQGKAVHRVQRKFVSDSLVLRGASSHELAAGESLIVVLRPAQFMAPMEYRLQPGTYLGRVRYHGPDVSQLAKMTKHWPDSPHAKAWVGEVASNEVSFSVSKNPAAPAPPTLSWGPEEDGLQAAIEFRVPKGVVGDPAVAPGIPVDSELGVYFHVKNVSDRPITFVSETSRQGDSVIMTDDEGNSVGVNDTWYSGWPIDVRWNLDPGDAAILYLLSPSISTNQAAGTYHVRSTIRFNSRQQKDEKGNIIFPAPGDWQAELSTGEATLILREETDRP